MKIPARILELAAAPILAAAAIGCSNAAPAAPAVGSPTPEPTQVEAPPDPVAYDAVAESERLARTDAVLAASERHRGARIADEEEAERRRATATLSAIRFDHHHFLARCGRG